MAIQFRASDAAAANILSCALHLWGIGRLFEDFEDFLMTVRTFWGLWGPFEDIEDFLRTLRTLWTSRWLCRPFEEFEDFLRNFWGPFRGLFKDFLRTSRTFWGTFVGLLEDFLRTFYVYSQLYSHLTMYIGNCIVIWLCI